jgi:hypothetical protein
VFNAMLKVHAYKAADLRAPAESERIAVESSTGEGSPSSMLTFLTFCPHFCSIERDSGKTVHGRWKSSLPSR